MTTAAVQLAGQQLGLNENAQNAAVSEYLANGGVNLDPAVTAWCAAFVNATLNQVGLEGTGSNMARSFESWGQEVATPQQGDLAVFHRNGIDSGFGHVGFFQGYDENGNVMVLGGNQGDSVSVAPYSQDQLLGFRRAPGEGAMPQAGQQDGMQAGMQAPVGQPQPSAHQNALQMSQMLQPASNQLDVADFQTPRRQNALIPIPGAV